MNADRDRPAWAIEIEQKKSWNQRINRWCIFSIWFSFSFSLVSRFKRYPSWQYRNKCQNLIWIYCIKQFQKKNVDKPNLRHSVFFLSFIEKLSLVSERAIRAKKQHNKKWFLFSVITRNGVYICDCKML